MTSIAHLLTQTLSVWRSVETIDSGGGRERTTLQVGTIRAKVDQPTPEEEQLAATWVATLSHVVRCEV